MAKHKFKEGDRFRVKSNNHGHNYQLDRVYVVLQRQPGGNGYYMGQDPETGFTGNWIYHTDMELATLTVADLQAEKVKLQEKIAEVDKKLAFLAGTGLEVFDADEYRIHAVLAALDATHDPVARTKAVAKLLREVV